MVITRNGLAAALAWALVMLGGCQTLPSLPDGRLTTLEPAAAARRASLAISVNPLDATPRYRATDSCRYSLTNTYLKTSDQQTWKVTPVRDRLLVNMDDRVRGVSTALIAPNGQLFDFNLVNAQTGQRSTSETFGDDAGVLASSLQKKAGGHAINELQLFLPHYEVESATYGDVVARIHDENGGVWAQFIYAGDSQFSGRRVVVLDLVRRMETMADAGPVVIGFNLVDAETALPVLSVLDLGFLYRLEQLGCD
jgi:hypothetical protein